MQNQLTRRQFLGRTTTAAAAIGLPTIIASRALGKDGQKPPSERITVGLIGTGGIARGQAHYGGPDAQVVALCDVNRQRRLEFKEKFDYGGCRDYNDFRDLLACKDIDAVHVSTPDHWHVPMAVLAAKAGKHMQVEKPLAMSVGELAALKKVLAGKELVFQFGTEARSNASHHKLVDLAANGFLGEIREAYVWGPGGGDPRSMAWFKGNEEPVPDGFDWDLWLGPAPKAPHNTWRWIGGRFSIHDYTLGPMSNWGIHPLNIMQWWADAAGLGVPVEYDGDVKIHPHPVIDNAYHWDVEARYAGGLKLHYMDSVVASKKLQEVPGLVDLINTHYAKQPEADRFHHGLVLVGEKGWIAGEYMGLYGSSLGDYVALMKTQLPSRAKEVQRSAGGHNADFIAAIRQRRQPVADFASTFNSDQIPVLVDLLGRTQSRFKWDPQRCEVLQCPAAAKFIDRPMREPWHSVVYKDA